MTEQTTKGINFKKLLTDDPNEEPKGRIAAFPEPTICIKCIFYQQRQYHHTCIAKIRKVTDFVTGKQRLRGFRNCTDANTDGKCPDYKGNEAWTPNE